MKELVIGGKTVSNDTRALVIAEAGINHDGSLQQAYRLIDVAADAGADVVKFQLFTAARMYTIKAGVYTTANGKQEDIYSLIKDVEMPESWIPLLVKKCAEREIGFLCTTCDERSTDVLDHYGVDAFKLASGAITHLPLIHYTAAKHKTMLFSEGASTLSEIDEAIRTIRRAGNDKIALLHCTTEYPASLSDCNVNVIGLYRLAFPDVIVGFSDHTMEPSAAPIQALKKGAKVIEKHFTIDKSLPGADHCFALDPQELKRLVEDVRYAERHLGEIEPDPVICGRYDKRVLPEEEAPREFIHRGLFAVNDIRQGEAITRDNIAVLRPGNSANGLSPKYYDLLISHSVKVNRDISAGSPITWQDVLSV